MALSNKGVDVGQQAQPRGGKPSKGTKADKRLGANKASKGKMGKGKK